MTEPQGTGAVPGPPPLRCDTCGREVATVSRVVIDAGYNRAGARAIYNCPACFAKKNQERGAADDGPP